MNLPKPGEKITRVEGRGVHVPGEDIDTDRIIPARFMKCITFPELEGHAFEDVRAQEREAGRVHPFDAPENKGAPILIVDGGFGAGSSREHAPQALMLSGVRAIIALSFNNGMFMDTCTTIGIVCATVSQEEHGLIVMAAQKGVEISVDLESQALLLGGFASVPLQIKPGARRSLMEGMWDSLTELMSNPDEVAAVAARVPPDCYEVPAEVVP